MTKESKNRTLSSWVSQLFVRTATTAPAAGILLMKSRIWMWTGASCLFAVLAIPAGLVAQDKPDHQPAITTFDVPGGGTGFRQGTLPTAINPKGTITGYYIDASGVAHGFLRDCDWERREKECEGGGGTITTFDVPGAGTDPQQGTFPTAINRTGEITGYYYAAGFWSHGFLRARDGSITTFDVPSGGDGPGGGTAPAGINAAGKITGYFLNNVSFAFNGFVRAHDGTLTTFDDPDAGTGFFQGTFVVGDSSFTFSNGGINAAGAIAAAYTDASNAQHGFLRAPDGTFTNFDVTGGSLTSPTAIGPDDAIAGIYFLAIAGNPFGGNFRGFLRKPDGSFSTFDAATYSPCCIWTFALAINSEGEIAGYDNDGHDLNHGFLRARNGTITTFDAPGAGTAPGQGTVADDINPEGVITGFYFDANNVSHGFVREGDREGRFRPRQ